ncbi:hypothetical protein DNTS_005288 [Danionella cerebrum]|uniref:Uncharacterized protein n=1 Tax=Danionella cerebrum TaxID=2873325 RepID=A0A553R8W3_9TELE|nr:hypothetical protein DNTS_005288 [Danionella translucida]
MPLTLQMELILTDRSSSSASEGCRTYRLSDLTQVFLYHLNQSLSSFPADDLPYLKCPLHVVLKLTPVAYGCKVEMFDLKVEAVNTHRDRPLGGRRQDVALPALLRRNSFTPLSSHDQAKRPRLFSVGNQPPRKLTSAPALTQPHLSESAELSESPVSSDARGISAVTDS